MTTSTQTQPWQTQILQQLGDADTDGATHAIVEMTDDTATLLDLAETEQDASQLAATHATTTENEVTVIALETLRDWHLNQTRGPIDDDGDTQLEPDPDNGKLFNIPRTEVTIDGADPSLLKIAFAGGIEIERNEQQWVEYYNRLAAGKTATITVTVHVAGSKKTHRRDKDGNVDAIVETKSLIITDVHLQDAAA